MFQTFLAFAKLACLIAAGASVILIIISIIYAFPKKEMPLTGEACKYINICKIIGIIFILCAWLDIPAEFSGINLNMYKQITDMCLCMGKLWIVLGFTDIVLSFFISLTKNRTNSLSVLRAVRGSSFAMGIIYFVLAFLLEVS